jgi:hypothetical protein
MREPEQWYRNLQKKWIKRWGKVSLGHAMYEGEFPEIGVRLCLTFKRWV